MCEDGAQRVLEGQRLCSEVCVVSVSTCEPPAQSGGCCPPPRPAGPGPLQPLGGWCQHWPAPTAQVGAHVQEWPSLCSERVIVGTPRFRRPFPQERTLVAVSLRL